MRLGIVRGTVVLSLSVPALHGTRMIIVEPVTQDSLAANGPLGGGKPIIAADQLGPGAGQLIGFVEGRTAASPYYPKEVPVDAYCALIADNIQYQPPAAKDTP